MRQKIEVRARLEKEAETRKKVSELCDKLLTAGLFTYRPELPESLLSAFRILANWFMHPVPDWAEDLPYPYDVLVRAEVDIWAAERTARILNPEEVDEPKKRTRRSFRNTKKKEPRAGKRTKKGRGPDKGPRKRRSQKQPAGKRGRGAKRGVLRGHKGPGRPRKQQPVRTPKSTGDSTTAG